MHFMCFWEGWKSKKLTTNARFCNCQPETGKVHLLMKS